MKLLENNMRIFRSPLFIFLCAACGHQAASLPSQHIVNIEKYKDQTCWIDVNQQLNSFVIFKRSQTGYFPIFVSRKCQLQHRNLSNGESIMSFPDAFPVSGDMGIAKKRGLLDAEIVSNTVDHSPPLNSDSKVFLIHAKVQTTKDRRFVIEDVVKLERVSIDVFKFLEGDLSSRETLTAHDDQ